MTYSAKILQDSYSPNGHRLTTFEITLPRLVLSELNTHKSLSKNSASSRAIPVEKQLKRVMENPFIPIYWGKNQKGMQADEELTLADQATSEKEWLLARDAAVKQAELLLKIGVHKQITNRLLEPFMWHTVIITGTEWPNFFALRAHKDAQPEIRKPALMMQTLFDDSIPDHLDYNVWHMPLLFDKQELLASGTSESDLKLISVGRCARVSYLTHDGKRNPSADIELYQRLREGGHMSPTEHVARPMTPEELELFRITEAVTPKGKIYSRKTIEELMKSGLEILSSRTTHFVGNLNGWFQLRKELPYEEDYSQILTA